MQFESTTLRDYKSRFIDNLRDRSGINDFSSTSKIGNIISIFLEDHQEKIKNVNSALESLRWTRAIEKDLEEIGFLLGVTRNQAVKASSDISERNFEFYVTSGTFGDINSGSSISIPKGTILFLEEQFSSSGTRVEFETLEDYILLSGSSSRFISVRCTEFGLSGNVRKNSIRKHTFTSYVDSSNESLKIRNNYAVINGKNEDTDEVLRANISTAWTANLTQNKTTFEQIINNYPGVREIRVIPFYNGLGTTAVITDFIDNNVSDSYIAALQLRVNPHTSLGEIITIYKPLLIDLDLTLTVNINAGLSSAVKLGISRVIRDYINLYFKQMNLSTSLNIESMIANIVALSTDITGTVVQDAFDEVTADYYDHSGNFVTKTITTNMIIPEQDQKITLKNLSLTLSEV